MSRKRRQAVSPACKQRKRLSSGASLTMREAQSRESGIPKRLMKEADAVNERVVEVAAVRQGKAGWKEGVRKDRDEVEEEQSMTPR